MKAADDGFSGVLHAAETACPGHTIHLLSYSVNSACKPQAAAGDEGEDASKLMQQRLWQLAADLVAWRPDVQLHAAKDLEGAAQHVMRLSRAVAEQHAGTKATVRAG